MNKVEKKMISKNTEGLMIFIVQDKDCIIHLVAINDPTEDEAKYIQENIRKYIGEKESGETTIEDYGVWINERMRIPAFVPSWNIFYTNHLA